MRLILASNSPRRKELLKKEGLSFEVIPSDFEETETGLSPKETVLKFSIGKARDVFEKYADCAVLGADTVVSLAGKILGKPKDEADAVKMLSALSGRTHSVFTGVCLLFGKEMLSGVVETEVTFNELSQELIEEYVKVKRPLDKAGAYGIQDGYPLVKEINGSYTNVVGLPMEKVREYLREAGI